MRDIFINLFIFLSIAVSAQQFTLPSQPGRNMVYVNPAYTGYYETTVLSLMNRTGLVGMPGKPQFQDLEIHAPLKKQSIALGLQVMHQQHGSTSSNEIFFNYAHRIALAKSKLVFGLRLGAISTSFGQVDLQDKEIYDPAFPVSNSILPNFGFGLAYYGKSFYSGISIPYLLGADAGTDGNAAIAPPDFNEFDFIINVGGKIPIGDEIKLEPHCVVIYSLIISPTYEAILNVNLRDKLIFGAGYRSEQALVGNLGYFINNQISFQYSYDYNFGNLLGNYSNGSHELSLLFYFGYKIKTVSPRDF